MEIAKCTVRIGGDIKNTVEKTDVTPAEILILRKLHGDDAVINIKATGKTPRNHREELMRLSRLYVERFTSDKDKPNIIKELFPGALPKLPLNFLDIVPEEMMADPEDENMKNKDQDGKLRFGAPSLEEETEEDKTAGAAA